MAVLVGCGGATQGPGPSPTPVAVVALGQVPQTVPTAAATPPSAPPSATAVMARSATPAPASTVPPTPTAPPPLTAALRQQIFTEVWTIINEHYLYEDFGGVDWRAVREEYAAQIAAAESDQAFYQLIDEMVGRLGDQHSRFLAPSAAQREDVLASGREEQVGIGVLTLPLADGLLIQHVFPDSPAARAGLRPRDRIVTIDGVFYTRRDLEGPEGSLVRLTVTRPGEGGRDVVITRRRVEGRITPQAMRLNGDIGYLGITTLWVGDMADQVGAGLSELSSGPPLRGLVIDLRSNPGGWRHVLTGVLSHFVRGEVGRFTSRKADMPLFIDGGPPPDLRGLPLAVLIDSGTASYAELMAAVLQRQAGAVVIGSPSAGNTETIYSYELTGGARLWVAQEGFALRDGASLEGLGVQPDIAVSGDWTRYSQEDDPWLQMALQMLMGRAGGK